MSSEHLIASELQLRKAVECRQYDSLPERLLLYGQAASGYMSSLPAGSPLRAETAARVLSTMNWASRILKIRRAALADKVSHLPLVSRYLEQNERKPSATLLDL